jgi:hypothetical protein
MVNSGNPFAEGGPSKTRTVGCLHEWLLFSNIFSSQNPVLDATVGKSSPLYSVNFALILSFLNRGAKVINSYQL